MTKWLGVFLVFCVAFVSCTSETDQIEHQVKAEWFKYKAALEMEDYNSAIGCVYNIIALDSNNLTYYDSLARLYYETKQFRPALLAAEKSMTFKLNERTVGIAYNIVKGGKDNSKKIEYCEMLSSFYPDSLSITYELAFNYAQSMDYNASKELLNKVILDPNSITQLYNEFRGNGVQEVPYRSAAYNLLGFIHTEQGESKVALDMFKSALNYKEDYILAQENLTSLTSQLADTLSGK